MKELQKTAGFLLGFLFLFMATLFLFYQNGLLDPSLANLVKHPHLLLTAGIVGFFGGIIGFLSVLVLLLK